MGYQDQPAQNDAARASTGSAMRRRESTEDSFLGGEDNPPVIGPGGPSQNRSDGG